MYAHSNNLNECFAFLGEFIGIKQGDLHTSTAFS